MHCTARINKRSGWLVTYCNPLIPADTAAQQFCFPSFTQVQERSVLPAQLCLFAQIFVDLVSLFFFTFVLPPWVSRLRSDGVCFNVIYNGVVFYFETWRDSLCCSCATSCLTRTALYSFDAASVKTGLVPHSLQSWAESCFWNASESCCSTFGEILNIRTPEIICSIRVAAWWNFGTRWA